MAFMSRQAIGIACGFLFGFSLTSRSEPLYAEWIYRLPITVTGYSGNALLTNFPQLHLRL